jgi:hypothetical protein
MYVMKHAINYYYYYYYNKICSTPRFNVIQYKCISRPTSINQFRRPGPIWAFAIFWLNLLWWRVGINLVNLPYCIKTRRKSFAF